MLIRAQGCILTLWGYLVLSCHKGLRYMKMNEQMSWFLSSVTPAQPLLHSLHPLHCPPFGSFLWLILSVGLDARRLFFVIITLSQRSIFNRAGKKKEKKKRREGWSMVVMRRSPGKLLESRAAAWRWPLRRWHRVEPFVNNQSICQRNAARQISSAAAPCQRRKTRAVWESTHTSKCPSLTNVWSSI